MTELELCIGPGSFEVRGKIRKENFFLYHRDQHGNTFTCVLIRWKWIHMGADEETDGK